MKMVFIWIDDQNQLKQIFVMSYAVLGAFFKKHAGTKSYETGFSTSRASREQLKFMEQYRFSEARSLQALIFPE